MKRVLVCGTCAEDRINKISYFGGAAGGIAANLASLGIPTGLLSVLGKDTFSKRYQKVFKELLVDTTLTPEGIQTLPIMTRESRKNAESARHYESNGAWEFLDKYQPLPEKLNTFDLLHVANTPKTLCDYLSYQFQGTISYNPGSLFVRNPTSLSLSLFEKASLIFCNQKEFTLLKSTLDMSTYFKKKLLYLIVTKAEHGVTLVTKTAIKDFPTTYTRSPLDTTGAGDAVAVGIIHALFDGKSIEAGIEEGQLLANKIISHHGVLL